MRQVSKANQDEVSAWGFLYELFVKRGVICSLVDAQLLSKTHPLVKEWSCLQLSQVQAALKKVGYADYNSVDTIAPAIQKSFEYQSKIGFAQGVTYTRNFIKKVKSQLLNNKVQLKVVGVWCPLTLPGEDTRTVIPFDASPFEASLIKETLKQREIDLRNQFNLGLFGRSELPGHFAHSDFLILFKAGSNYHLLTQEYSFFANPSDVELYDKSNPADLLKLYRTHRRYIDSKSVFSNLTTEAQNIPFEFTKSLDRFLPAFTRKEKPIFKLAQGCCYANTFAQSFYPENLGGERRGKLYLHCMAITSRDAEFISAEYKTENKSSELVVLQNLARKYQNKTLSLKDMEQKKNLQMELKNFMLTNATDGLKIKLSRSLKGKIEKESGEIFKFTEVVKGFLNPNTELSFEKCRELIDLYVDEKLKDTLAANVDKEMALIKSGSDFKKTKFTLRDLHKCAVVTAIQSSEVGRINFICLEGTPGIGKTSSVKSLLKDLDGFFFFFTSPRVLINDDVMEDLAGFSVTLTCNGKVVKQARPQYEKVMKVKAPDAIQGAVLVDGPEKEYKRNPKSSVFLINKNTYEEITDFEKHKSSIRINQASSNKVTAQREKATRVLKSLSVGAKDLIDLNSDIRKLTMTVATQAFIKNPNGDTLQDLRLMFKYNIHKDRVNAIQEREDFAKRFPHLVVMFDEVTGDAGSRGFISAFEKFIKDEFITPFEISPLKVTIIISDASLSNESAMNAFMGNTSEMPPKIIVTPSDGDFPFKMTTTPMNIGLSRIPTIHILANCYPALEDQLTINYIVETTEIKPEVSKTLLDVDIQHTMIKSSEDEIIATAISMINEAIGNGRKQVIYYAQNKRTLAAIKDELIDRKHVDQNYVAVFDSTLSHKERSELLDKKEKLKVVLITSTAARGISFPNCDSIIALMPRFEIEANLMEIGQLIYRGRGGYYDDLTLQWINGDEKAREISILIQDFFVNEEQDQERAVENEIKSQIDILTMFLLVRGSLLTRIRGDAGLLNRNLSIIPVGEVSDKKNQFSLSKMIADLLRGLEDIQTKNFSKADKDKVSDESTAVGLLKVTCEQANYLYKMTAIESFKKQGDLRNDSFMLSSVESGYFIDWTRKFHSQSSRLVDPDWFGDNIPPCLPDNIYCTGPAFLEDRSCFQNKESFRFEQKRSTFEEMRSLKGRLWAIMQRKDIKKTKEMDYVVNESIKVLDSLIEYNFDNYLSTLERAGDMTNLWLAYPVTSLELKNSRNAELEAEWAKSLSKELNVMCPEFPVIPLYKFHPFVGTQQISKHPTLAEIFKSKEFMMSFELNLMNVLTLFPEES